jgi:hypothetical protein
MKLPGYQLIVLFFSFLRPPVMTVLPKLESGLPVRYWYAL